MIIFINKFQAVLSENFSMEYNSENRLFSGADAYSMNITLPLKGCPQNQRIFQNINRMDAYVGRSSFECEIRDKRFCKFGSVTITSINDVEVTVQFLEGRSDQNFNKSFDEIFINDLDLGNPLDCDDSSPSIAWNPRFQNYKCVALPWVNDYSGNIQNLADYDEINKSYAWNKECKGRSWQPYLLYITKKICDAVGYSYDFSKWEENENLKFLLICNSIPYAWDTAEFSKALPKWSVAEYFTKLEQFLFGEFNIDHRSKEITFDFIVEAVNSIEPVLITDVINEHSVEVDQDSSKCEYQVLKNYQYKECSHEMWKFYSCSGFIEEYKDRIIKYSSMAELINKNRDKMKWNGTNGRGSEFNNFYYVEEVDAYFSLYAVSRVIREKHDEPVINTYTYDMVLIPINLFGPQINDSSDQANYIEIEFVPAWIDETEEKYGNLLFLSFGSYDESDSSDVNISHDKEELDNIFRQPYCINLIKKWEEKKSTEYYDRIYLGWWKEFSNWSGKLPHPLVENVEVKSDWSSYNVYDFSLRLNDGSLNKLGSLPKINNSVKYTFSFLSDIIPDPRAVFFIKGKKYLCEKLTANFDSFGMSQLIKGEFWQIVD